MFASRNSRYLKKPKKIDIEPQEILLDKLAQRKERELGLSSKKLEAPLSKKILLAFLALCLSLLVVLFLKTLQLQTVQAEDFRNELEKNKFIVQSIEATRGVIYDKDLKQLVFNRPAFDLILNKNELPSSPMKKSEILREVCRILEKDRSEMEKEIEKEKGPRLLVAQNLDHQTLILLETKINQLAGFKIEDTTIREYGAGQAFSHLLGYTGKISREELKEGTEFYSMSDYVGRDGLEKTYEDVLRRTPGKLRVERDAVGNPLAEKILSLSQAGKSLVLFLDSALQNKTAQVLEKVVKQAGASKGAVVALNPKTGGILAMVSFPFFDNNLFSKKADPALLSELLNSEEEPLFNRAVSGLYPAGSIIKPLIAAGALEEKIISPDKNIYCPGFIALPNPYYPDIGPEEYKYHDWTVHYWTDMRRAIAESCNVYFYTIGGGYEGQQGLGASKIKKYLGLFNWGELTGFDLAGEKSGSVPDPAWKASFFKNKAEQIWYDGDTYNLSIGQGYVSVTPLQVATAFSAIANGGKVLRPRVVQKVIKGSAKPQEEMSIIKEFKPEVIRDGFIAQENLEVVRQGMRQAVTHGSAANWLNSLNVPVAAKTGTAQSAQKGHYHNWVAVFGPYEDPEIVLVVLVENVPEIRTAALPIAREILQWYFLNNQ